MSVLVQPKIATGFRFQWEQAQQNFVLLYPEGMVKLNQSAGEILSLCDGQRQVSEIVSALEAKFATTGLGGQVDDFLAFAQTKGWLCEAAGG
jgi:pyrroloquinoline quinone biosynthesis protein D